MLSPDFLLDPNAPDERLERWLDGDLPAAEAAEVDAAVQQYEAWAQAARAARHVQGLLKATPRPEVPPDFAACVLAEVERREQASRVLLVERLRAGLRVPVWQPAIALAVVVLVAVAMWPRSVAPTDAEVAATLEEVRWTLAYLSHTSEKTGVLVRDRVITPHVVAPVRQVLGSPQQENESPQP